MIDKNIKGFTDLIKRGSAIVNTDDEAYRQALLRREKEMQFNDLINKQNQLEEKVNDIDDKLSKILKILEGK